MEPRRRSPHGDADMDTPKNNISLNLFEDTRTALLAGNPSQVEDAIAENPELLNFEDGKNMTLLHYAIKNRDTSTACYLIQKGADGRRKVRGQLLTDFIRKYNPNGYDELVSALKRREQSTISVVSYNVYLIPGWFVNQSSLTCKNQGWRASGLGYRVNNFDIIHLQEMWGSSMDKIELGLKNTHIPIDGYASIGGTFLDSIKATWTEKGGLYCSHRSDITVEEFRKHVFTVSATKSKKGVIAMLYNADLILPGKYVLGINTHLDPYNIQNKQERQIEQVVEFIRETVEHLAKRRPTLDFSKTALIMTGDFNIDSQTRLYRKLIEISGVRDLYLEYCTEGGIRPQNTHCSANPYADNFDGRIDYVFSIDRIAGVEFAPVKVRSAEVITQELGKEFSDHW
eukprot:CAMPEP_0115027140 /NCGR_PEP_ID=MMETSP0216-20121206/35270_1 /TAXON_ID=223996 /ORGANISM="Protocruzia adherens, Strain Boccale" /LENGTH=398 /DNA_ID=CAMNT_0002402561 /DNA_START=3434 /DNA_END=4627 /DNA_ORIENTATION=-